MRLHPSTSVAWDAFASGWNAKSIPLLELCDAARISSGCGAKPNASMTHSGCPAASSGSACVYFLETNAVSAECRSAEEGAIIGSNSFLQEAITAGLLRLKTSFSLLLSKDELTQGSAVVPSRGAALESRKRYGLPRSSGARNDGRRQEFSRKGKRRRKASGEVLVLGLLEREGFPRLLAV